MSDQLAFIPFGKTQIPISSTNENTASYIVSRESFTKTHPEIVTYYTFPGFDDYINMPSVIRNIKEESYIPRDIA
jgi:hypothetical protein